MLLYAISTYGTGLSEDSISYLSAAHSLHASGAMRDIDGSPFVAWAPLFPFIISLHYYLPFKQEILLAVFNLIAFILTLITAWKLIERSMEQVFYKAACLIFILLSYAIIQVFAAALSEAFFLLLVNLILLILLREKQKRGDFLLLGLLCGLAILQRYAGIFLIPVVLYSFWERRSERNFRGRLLLFLFLSLAPVAIWLARNWSVSGTLTGFRPPGDEHFTKNILALAETFTSWIFPVKIPLVLRAALVLAVFALIRKMPVNKAVKTCLVFTGFYFTFLITAYLLFSFEEPRDRLLAPVFIPFSLLLFSSLEKNLLRTAFIRNSPSAVRYSVSVLICAWLLYPAVRITKHLRHWHSTGVEVYNNPSWKNSETIQWLRENRLSAKIFSNDPYAVYYFTGKSASRIPKSIYRFDAFRQSAQDGDYLVWWNDARYALYDLKKIETDFKPEKITNLQDGVIYRLRARN